MKKYLILSLLILTSACAPQVNEEKASEFPPDVAPQENTISSTSQKNPDPVPDSELKRATLAIWNGIKENNTSIISNYTKVDTTVKVNFSFAIPAEEGLEETFSFTGLSELSAWIDTLHSPQGESKLIWKDAFGLETSDERYLYQCDELSCIFDGGIQHNNLFITKISFKNSSGGKLLLSEIDIVHGS